MKNQPDIKFYDTCSLLLAGENIILKEEKFIISSITLKELENIKTSAHKDEEIKYQARKLLHLLEVYRRSYDVIVHRIEYEDVIKQAGLDVTDDTRILSDALYANNIPLYVDRVIFVTNDLSLKNIANLFFGNEMIESVKQKIDNYTGYKEIKATEEEQIAFYNDNTRNHFNLYIGEYLILENLEGEIIDVRQWTGTEHRYIKHGDFNSISFGKIKPYDKDIYQKLLFDSLMTNKMTMVKGPAGSGKTLISLGYLMSQLEAGALDKIIIFCNTIATANSAKLGYLPGTKDEKLLDSQIGNLLISKFGGRDAVERLIRDEELILLPFSDLRGFDTSGMKAGIYISEAQNLDITLMKLALQRVGEDCICIIDGDEKSQVDLLAYAGNNNGMRRVSKVYRGTEIYGEVTLQNIYRSRIARIADKL